MQKKSTVISKTRDYVRKTFKGEGTGHDWWHIYRVWNMARRIAYVEKGADLFVVELAALLHDIADWKFNNGDETAGPLAAGKWLTKMGVDNETINHICGVIGDMSFKGAGVKTRMNTIEGMIVQDADRLDAMGAIGIARTFAYGGFKGREIYNPDVKFVKHKSFEEYRKSTGTTINHFYEKLLLLEDLMNTATAKKIARKRHEFMLKFLDRFYREWDGEA